MAAALPGVLAVMDSDRGDAVMARAARYKAEHAIALERRSVETRAAVAELIEANRKIAAIYGPLSASMRIGSERREAWRELFAALARVQGGAP